jgi:hypothetical protein
MVSKANVDFPDPDRPEITMILSRGNSTSIFFRLCSRAPFITIFFVTVLHLPDFPQSDSPPGVSTRVMETIYLSHVLKSLSLHSIAHQNGGQW